MGVVLAALNRRPEAGGKGETGKRGKEEKSKVKVQNLKVKSKENFSLYYFSTFAFCNLTFDF